MGDLTFYTNPMSRGRIVRWMLEEVGAPYETVLLDYQTSMKAPEFRAINPMGKVPAIRHGTQVVTEAAAICAYLADAFPDAGLAPAPAQRGAYYRWLFFAAGPVEQVMLDKSRGTLAAAEQRAMAGYGSLEDVVGAIEGAIGTTGWIAGDRFSAADVYVCAMLGWTTQFGIMERTPPIAAYLERGQARPAYQRAIAIDDQLLAELQAR